MRRLLVFTAYYTPEVASSIYLCENLYNDLAQRGMRVELFTPMPTRGVSKEVRRKYKKKRKEINIEGNLNIHRVSLMKEDKKNFYRFLRYVNMNIIFVFKSLFVKADAIFVQSTPPTQGAMAAIIKKIKRIPFIYNLQDIFPDSMVKMGIASEKSLIFKFGLFIEKFTYKNADKIIVISNDMRKCLIKKGVPEKKIEVISNWVDTNVIKPIDKNENHLFKKYKLSKEYFYVVYAGNLGYAQDIDVILNVAYKLSSYKKIKFVIFGNGVLESTYKQKATEMDLSNLIFLPLQPYSDVSYVYSMASVSIVSCKKDFGENAMPSKTWNIMATSTPVLASFDKNTDMENLIKKYSLGLFNEAGDFDMLAKNIIEMYSDENKCEEYGLNARRYVESYLCRELCTEKYYTIIQSVF